MAKHINLLPPERRQNLQLKALHYAAISIFRTIIISLGLISFTAVAIAVSLWSFSHVATVQKDEELNTRLTEYRQLRSTISSKNAMLELVATLSEQRTVWSEIINELLTAMPPGVTIDSLSGDSSLSTIEISGEAITRNSLVVLEERLSQISWVKGVTAPRRNLLNRYNTEYTFEISISNPLATPTTQ